MLNGLLPNMEASLTRHPRLVAFGAFIVAALTVLTLISTLFELPNVLNFPATVDSLVCNKACQDARVQRELQALADRIYLGSNIAWVQTRGQTMLDAETTIRKYVAAHGAFPTHSVFLDHDRSLYYKALSGSAHYVIVDMASHDPRALDDLPYATSLQASRFSDPRIPRQPCHTLALNRTGGFYCLPAEPSHYVGVR